jgi:hypothetical protein
LVASTPRPARAPARGLDDGVHELLALDVLLSAAEEAASRAHARLERTTSLPAARVAHAAFEEAEQARKALLARRQRLIADEFGQRHLKLVIGEERR